MDVQPWYKLVVTIVTFQELRSGYWVSPSRFSWLRWLLPSAKPECTRLRLGPSKLE